MQHGQVTCGFLVEQDFDEESESARVQGGDPFPRTLPLFIHPSYRTRTSRSSPVALARPDRVADAGLF